MKKALVFLKYFSDSNQAVSNVKFYCEYYTIYLLKIVKHYI